jgi:hypothetical protein
MVMAQSDNTVQVENETANSTIIISDSNIYVGQLYTPLIFYPWTSFWGAEIKRDRITIGGENSSLNVDAGAHPLNNDFGHVAVNSSDGIERAHLTVEGDASVSWGSLELWGGNGTGNVSLGAHFVDKNRGYISVQDSFGNFLSEFTGDDQGGTMTFRQKDGVMVTYGFDGAGNFIQLGPSDERLKENITCMSKILPKVLMLSPSVFNYKGLEEKTFGLIAQNVQTVFPSLVRKMHDTPYYGVNYTRFGVLAIQAIKEQQEIIEALESNQMKLEKRLAKLEALISERKHE